MHLWPYGSLKRAMVKVSSVTPAGREYLAATFAGMSRRDFLTVWSAVTRAVTPGSARPPSVPTLLIRGEHDDTGNIVTAMLQWAERDGLQYAVVGEAGHIANFDQPDATNQLIVGFLSEHLIVAG